MEKLTANEDSKKFTKTPLEVRRNMSFLVDVSSYKNWQDIKSDINGAFPRILRIVTRTLALEEDGSVQILQKKVALKKGNELHIHIN